MSWQDVLSKARWVVRKKAAYYTETLLSLTPYPVTDPGFKTMGVTKGLVLVFSPTFVEEIGVEKCAGVLVHEIHHVARRHLKRIDVAIQPYMHLPNLKDIQFIANCAADIAINPNVLEEGWELPANGLMPEDFQLNRNLLFEEYFQLLLQLGADQVKEKRQQKGDGSGDPNGDITSGACGSIAGNSLGDVEAEADAYGARSKTEVESIAGNQAKELARVAAQGRGSLPRDLAESIAKEGKSRMPYYRLLGKYIQDRISLAERGMEGFSKRLPSRKSFVTGIVRAGLIEGTPEVCIIWDTSGSMGAKQLSACWRETVGVLRACDIPEVWVIQADADVSLTPTRMRVGNLSKLKAHGRGGTSFDPALRALEQLRPKPQVAIYLTDGDGRAAFKPKGIDVIWAVVESRWKRKPDASFGKVVFIPD